MFADLALQACLQLSGVRTVLDVGSGTGEHAALLRDAGKVVTTISLSPPADIVGDYMESGVAGPFDLIWVSHTLEHQRNVGAFLDRCRGDLREGGWLAVTVPPMKPEVVGGHVALFNAGVLLYHLIVAGFDCREASVRSYGYNVSVIVQNSPAGLPSLARDCGDIERLAPFFPMPVRQGFDGNIERVNWPWH